MTEGGFHAALRRKIDGFGPGGQPGGRGRDGRGRAAPASPERLVVQALQKAAQAMMGLPVLVEENAAAVLTLAELVEHLPDRALLALLTGPGDRLGVAAMDAGAVAALIEMQMTGRIGLAEVSSRRPTATDAAICSLFLDRLLVQLDQEAAGADADPGAPRDGGGPGGGDRPWSAGWRYGTQIEDPRPLGLLLEDGDYRCFRVRAQFGIAAADAAAPGGARSGMIVLALPDGGAADAGAAAADQAAAADWQDRLTATVLRMPARLEADLCRIAMPLGRALALRPGMEIALPPGCLAAVELRDGAGELRATARLGQARGQRALRLAATGAEARASRPPGRETIAGDSGAGRADAALAADAARFDADATADATAAPPARGAVA